MTLLKLNFDNGLSCSDSNDDENIVYSDINECKLKIDELYHLYNNNDYIKNKIKNYILLTLPNTLNNLIINNEKKLIKKEKTQNNINEFICKFLNTNKYFYNTSSDIYFHYDNKDYNIIKEDTISNNINIYINKFYKKNNILNQIENSQINEIYEMREKIRNTIFKKIRETSIDIIIPESITIQNIFSILVPSFFNDKNMTKYFLVCIGDIILKKNNCIFLINNNSKQLIKILSSYSYNYFGTSYFSDFKYKYHEQQKNCKLIKIRNITPNYINHNFLNNILNILCVAIHYSVRFNNSENYLENEMDINQINYINLLVNNKIIDNFIDNNLESSESNDNTISNKSMHYLWNDFLTQNDIPIIYFSTTIKNILKTKLKYCETGDYYTNILSNKLPIIRNFLTFWNNNFYINNSYNESEEFNVNEIDSSEILSLYKNYLITKCQIKEDKIIQLLIHYDDNIIIKNNNILNIQTELWNKENDINQFIDFYKKKLHTNNEDYPQSLVSLYYEYINYAKKFICIVNKNYFIDYFKYNYSEYIEDDILLTSWWKI